LDLHLRSLKTIQSGFWLTIGSVCVILGAAVMAGGAWVAGIVVAFGAVMAYSGFRAVVGRHR
jgi:hypothetical protein